MLPMHLNNEIKNSEFCLPPKIGHLHVFTAHLQVCHCYSTAALQSDDESALHAIVASNEDTVALYIAAVLQITHHLTNETDVVLTTVQLVSAVVGGIVFGIIVCLCIILVVIVVCCCRKHHTK